MSESVEKKVAEFIRRHGMFAGAGRILAAVSGGADSTSLLHILQALRTRGLLQAELVCVHVNHQLRGQASDADERFVVEQAGSLGVPVVVRSVDVRAHAERHKLSLETAARQLRLAALDEVAREQGCSWIATGHQKNDNAETVLHRLQRGTGFRGLAGIRPVRQFREGLWLASPLLCLTRDEIVGYLRMHALPWREDHTNIDVAYTRNYIRHKLLPLLQRESEASIINELSELATSAGRLYDRIQRHADKVWAAMVQPGDNEVHIEASGLASLPEPVAIELIRRALASLGCGERDLTEGHYRRVLHLARQRPVGKETSLPDGFAARYVSDGIVLSQRRVGSGIGATHAPCVLNIPGTTRFAPYEIEARVLGADEVDIAKIAGDKSPFIEYLDWGRVKPPVVVRPRQAGDRFQPLGLDATKKVGKFLTTAKVPRELRDRTVVIADQERIIWVCPVRIAEPVKVTEETRQILMLTVRCIGRRL